MSATTDPSAIPRAVHDLARHLPVIPVGSFEQAEVHRREQPAVQGPRLRPAAARRRPATQAVATAAAEKPRRKTPAPWRPIPLCISGLTAALKRVILSAMLPEFFREHARTRHQDVDRPPSRCARGDEGGVGHRTPRHALGPGARRSSTSTSTRPSDGEGAICQDTGMPTFEIHVPRGADQIWMAGQIRHGGRRGDEARQAAPELRRLDHRQELRQQPRARHAGHPLPPVGAGRHRGEAAAQGRRLRELQRAVRRAGGAGAPRPRGPQPRRRAQVHPARRLAGAGQGLQPRRRRRLHRRRPRVGLRRTRRSSCSGRWTT